MEEKLTAEQIKTWLEVEEQEFYIDKFRDKHGIVSDSSTFYTTISRMVTSKELKRLGRGLYRRVKRVSPVNVFNVNREIRPPIDLRFPLDYNKGIEVEFANSIVIREHDVITIGGQSNWGKTTWALNFCGANVDMKPILMGNEYTSRIGDTDDYEPTQRFMNRLKEMQQDGDKLWVQWTDAEGRDKFTLLPVKSDYAEHIVKDRINIIDWINLDADKLYNISKVMDDIKAELGRGVGIIVLQKGEGTMARGGQFTKDFTDCELLIDKFNDKESLLTIGKVKEYTNPIIGKTYAFGISRGVRIVDFREVKRCVACKGQGYSSGNRCTCCNGNKYVDVNEVSDLSF